MRSFGIKIGGVYLVRPSVLPDEIVRMLLQGNSRRKAIKRFRKETSAGRADSPHAISNFPQRHRSQSMLSSYADLILVVLVIASMLLGALLP